MVHGSKRTGDIGAADKKRNEQVVSLAVHQCKNQSDGGDSTGCGAHGDRRIPFQPLVKPARLQRVTQGNE